MNLLSPFLRQLFIENKKSAEFEGEAEDEQKPEQDQKQVSRASGMQGLQSFIDPNMPKEDYRLISEKLTF